MCRGPEAQRTSQLGLRGRRWFGMTPWKMARVVVGTNGPDSKAGLDAGEPREQLALESLDFTRAGFVWFTAVFPAARRVTSTLLVMDDTQCVLVVE